MQQYRATDRGAYILTTGTHIAAPNPTRQWLSIQNSGTTVLHIVLLRNDDTQAGIITLPNQYDSVVFDANMPWPGKVWGLSMATTGSIVAVEVDLEP